MAYYAPLTLPRHNYDSFLGFVVAQAKWLQHLGLVLKGAKTEREKWQKATGLATPEEAEILFKSIGAQVKASVIRGLQNDS